MYKSKNNWKKREKLQLLDSKIVLAIKMMSFIQEQSSGYNNFKDF